MKKTAFKSVTTTFLFSIIIGLPAQAYAFKVGAHVWIAQQVIDDLQDGEITIELDGQQRDYVVRSDVRDAILSNPSIYRMGNIGPDASPDILGGQLVIHPGTDSLGTDNWAILLDRYVHELENRVSDEDWYEYQQNVCDQQTYDLHKVWEMVDDLSDDDNDEGNPWLEYPNQIGLLDALAEGMKDPPMNGPRHPSNVNPAELAYQQGFLGHMASDVFAHSYVNYYAGDVFWILDGELDVEKRHVAIEAYIDKHLPPLPQGELYNLISPPSDFLADAFIFNKQAAQSFAEADAPVPTFLAIYKLRKAIRETAASCVWTAVERLAGQIVIGELTGYVPSEEQIAVVNQLIDDANQLNSNFINELNSLKNDLDANIEDRFLQDFDRISSVYSGARNTISEAIDIQREINDVTDRIENEIVGEICDYEVRICEEHCEIIPHPWPLDDEEVCDDICDYVPGPACATHGTYQYWTEVRDDLIADRQQRIDRIGDDLERVKEAMLAIHETANDLSNAVAYAADFPLDSVDPFRNALKRWDQQITLAMTKWVEANAEVIRNTMEDIDDRPKAIDDQCWKVNQGIGDCLFPEDSAIQPLLDWQADYAPSLIGIPTEFSQVIGGAGNTLSSIRSLVDGSVRNVFLDSVDALTRARIVELERNVSAELSDTDVIDEVLRFAGQGEIRDIYKDLHAVFALNVDDAAINQLFMSDNSDKGLMTQPLFAYQLRADMGIDGEGHVDPDEFAALNNAVVLSKLALLDNTQLNELAADLDVPYPTQSYADFLYSPCASDSCSDDYGSQNILYRAVKNIDGSEQWKAATTEEAFLRRSGFSADENSIAESEFGYSFGYQGSDAGFRFWVENTNGEYFHELFDMPLHGETKKMLPAILVPINALILD